MNERAKPEEIDADRLQALILERQEINDGLYSQIESNKKFISEKQDDLDELTGRAKFKRLGRQVIKFIKTFPQEFRNEVAMSKEPPKERATPDS
jgi:hypothetical protein